MADEEGAEEAPPEPPAEKPEGPEVVARVQVRPSYGLSGDNPEEKLYLPCLPQVKEMPTEYKPMPYTFRVGNVQKFIKNGVAKRVPFYVQLDHTIAVLWKLFNADTAKPLGIAQMQWALSFLNAIHNRYGEHPQDVQYCIDILEESLIDQYADMASDLDIIEDYHCDCCPGRCMAPLVIEDLPFSINYQEIAKWYPHTSTAYRVPSMTEEELHQELQNIKLAAGVESLNQLDCVSREKAIDFLSAWKKDQVEKIQADIERLQSIENMLKTVDNDRFESAAEPLCNSLMAKK